MMKDIARNLTGFSISGVFASLNTEYHDALRLRPLLQRAMPKAAKLPKVYDIQAWRVELLLRHARMFRFSTFKTSNTMKEKKWRIELTEHQLRLIANCVEDCHRFIGGQMELSNSTACLKHYRHLGEELATLQPFVTPELGRGASYGWDGGTCPDDKPAQVYRRNLLSVS